MKRRTDVTFHDLNYFEEKGFFDNYSENHFLMKILSENAQLPERFQKEVFQKVYKRTDNQIIFDNKSFKLSFAARLCNMFSLFEDKDINNFLKGQLAAGKEEYNQDTFFQALSEVQCINYVANMVPNSEKIECEYEPKNNGSSNPEARIKFGETEMSNSVYDIEVKTAKFEEVPIEEGKRYIKLNIPLLNNGYIHLKEMAELCNYHVILPNYLKVKDYIISADKKFIEPSDENHVNILFINWSFISPTASGIMEPCSLLYDENVGLLKSEILHEICKINKEHLKKISAIVVYCDNYDSFISVNLLDSVSLGLCKIMINDKFCKYVDKEKILEDLRIQEVSSVDGKVYEFWGDLSSNKEENFTDAYVMAEVAKILYKYM